LDPDSLIRLTPRGFRTVYVSESPYLHCDQPLQFFFVQPTSLPRSVRTLGALARMQEQVPGCMVVDVDSRLSMVFEHFSQEQINRALEQGLLRGHEALQSPLLQRILLQAGDAVDLPLYDIGRLSLVPHRIPAFFNARGSFRIDGLPPNDYTDGETYCVHAPIDNVWGDALKGVKMHAFP
jgi:hypothetical protein